MDLRDTINRHLKRSGRSRYSLTKDVEGLVPASTIYGFLSGRHTIGSDALDHLLDAAGLAIVPTDDKSASAPAPAKATKKTGTLPRIRKAE